MVVGLRSNVGRNEKGCRQDLGCFQADRRSDGSIPSLEQNKTADVQSTGKNPALEVKRLLGLNSSSSCRYGGKTGTSR